MQVASFFLAAAWHGAIIYPVAEAELVAELNKLLAGVSDNCVQLRSKESGIARRPDDEDGNDDQGGWRGA